MSDSIDQKLDTFKEFFNAYLDKELKCVQKINSILEIKKNIKKLVCKQNEDDVIFYQAIVENSYYYLQESLNIRVLKFIKDLNNIWKKIDERKIFIDLTKINFNILLKDLRTLNDDITIIKENSVALPWMKNDTIVHIHDIVSTLESTLEYHNKLIDSFLVSIQNEYTFFCTNNLNLMNSK